MTYEDDGKYFVSKMAEEIAGKDTVALLVCDRAGNIIPGADMR